MSAAKKQRKKQPSQEGLERFKAVTDESSGGELNLQGCGSLYAEQSSTKISLSVCGVSVDVIKETFNFLA